MDIETIRVETESYLRHGCPAARFDVKRLEALASRVGVASAVIRRFIKGEVRHPNPVMLANLKRQLKALAA